MQDQTEKLVEDLIINFSDMRRQHMSRHASREQCLWEGERAVMFCVHSAGPAGMRATDIAQALNVAAPTITPVLNRLQAKGFVSRGNDERDRRIIMVSLTKHGEEVLHQCMEHHRGEVRGLVDYLGEQEAQNLLRIMEKVKDYYSRVYKR
ncbi:MarR family winged helix-turn-helix transcriptional regulator [Ligaoa zhengdingensis]|uniref:MarR family winged helix-turn-helix transcriptional regulator n=1 Tax=Ligaoa zhengdingensis TaxID=2763658 RepID=UPI0031BA5E8D